MLETNGLSVNPDFNKKKFLAAFSATSLAQPHSRPDQGFLHVYTRKQNQPDTKVL
jgi:hypothetical protein